MAKIENVPSELLDQLKNSVCAFTDDSRLIFMASTEELCLRISVYDILYNTFRKLSNKISLTEFFNEPEGNFQTSRLPCLLVIDHQTLVVSYDPECFYGPRENFVSILVVSVDFGAETFSIIQQLEYTDLYRSILIRDGFNALLLYNISDQDRDSMYLCRPFKFDSRQMVQTRSDSINLLAPGNHGYGSPTHERLHKKKLWCIVSAWDRGYWHQLMYFDLKQERPTAVTVKFFEESLNLFHVQCLKSHFLFYTNEGEKPLTFFDLDTEQWSTVANNTVLKKYDYVHEQKLTKFCNGSDHFVDRFHFDHELNMMALDKVERRIHRIPFGKPRKLADLVRTSAVNSRLLDQKRLEKLFQNEPIYLK